MKKTEKRRINKKKIRVKINRSHIKVTIFIDNNIIIIYAREIRFCVIVVVETADDNVPRIIIITITSIKRTYG